MTTEAQRENDDDRRELRRLVQRSREVCILSHGCRSPIYQCPECPFKSKQ